ncbi:uncharacterized protein LOC124420031 [Lucilia cuprina]|uniref:uncharacterized protein LOC124420031 n=1 Tax=Lucilia cuprina TaxID=7375 RepID=UPI001F062B46|nr:uncharacterized protein LOC124420031 [Lucilia cuprina]
MSNQAEIDYEKQFQEDLAKATALSLEQQALEEFKRCQKYGIAYTQSVQQEAKNRNYAQIRRQHFSRRDSAETSVSSQYGITLPPPQSSQPQRRHSEITHNVPPTTLLTDVERSKTPPASTATAENDLINFASPTAKKPENSSFEQLIEDLQKLQATNPQTALVPLGPTAAAPLYPGYHAPTTSTPAAALYAGSAAAIQPPAQYGVTTAAGAAGMQLVPFTPPPQQQKVPLTHNELQKLYSMSQPPYTAPVYAGARPMGFMPPLQAAAGAYYPQTPPVMVAGAAGVPYTAPLQYPNPYGFQYNVLPQAPQQHYYPTNMATAASLNSSSVSTSSLASGVQNLNNQSNQSFNATELPSSSNSFNNTHSKHSNISSTSSSQSNGQNVFRRQTPPARKPKTAGSDLIDLSHEDDSRVSVLEAFDPLLNEDNDGKLEIFFSQFYIIY